MPEHTSEHAIPDGYATVTPWIISKDAAGLIRFLEAAFAAQETAGSRMLNPDGSIAHVEVKIGNSIVMLFDSYQGWAETPAFFRLYLDDADTTFQQALMAGASSVTEVTELFWGDRVGRARDPFGNIWWLQSHVADVPYDEMQARMTEPAMIEAMQYVQQSLVDALRVSANTAETLDDIVATTRRLDVLCSLIRRRRRLRSGRRALYFWPSLTRSRT